MTMNIDLTGFLLAQVTTYGALALGLMMFLRGLGLPLPTGLVVMTSGALARSGQVEWPAAALLAFGGVVLGDIGSYLLGRFAGDRLRQRLTGNRAAAWERAQAWIQRQGTVAVLASRSALSSLDAPISWIAGSSGYGLGRFLTWDLIGRLGWLLFHGGLGYLFAGQWESISLTMQGYAGWLAGLAALVLGAYLARRLLQRCTSGARVLG
jgi:membrane protein DedA with SNARE-associated domain